MCYNKSILACPESFNHSSTVCHSRSDIFSSSIVDHYIFQASRIHSNRRLGKSPWGLISMIFLMSQKSIPILMNSLIQIYMLLPLNTASSRSMFSHIFAFLVGIPLPAPAAPSVYNPSHPSAGLNFSSSVMQRFDPHSWSKIGYGSRF